MLAVITGTPDWAARPASGCERSGTQPRSRAPKASAMGAYRKLVTDVAALGQEVGVELRYWSAWNEPNHPFFISPQRASCSTSAKSLAAVRYTEMVRNLKRALDDAPGDQEYVLGELAGLDESKTKSTSIREFLGDLPKSVVCGSTILSQHGYITGINPVGRRRQGRRDQAVQEEARGVDDRDRRRRATRRRGQADDRAGRAQGLQAAPPPARPVVRRPARHRRLPVHASARTTSSAPGSITTDLTRAFPVLKEWQAWGGPRAPSRRTRRPHARAAAARSFTFPPARAATARGS